ncbi:MAG: hypothetical protein HKN57_14085 [Xanthomonadales bacterium]|nr:hypothetical protein [Gammaproteobacteria bacterium]MBT8055140.1 hypothetical protein [Gammaproteobacteria bacterium]NND58371.1 hypothetical protein [Xanthomonadales bacterium]NNK51734.1 hypothetical protein [Xanthomonadales bacterium]
MSVRQTQTVFRAGALLTCLLLWVAPLSLVADDHDVPVSVLANDTLRLMSDDRVSDFPAPASFPLAVDNDAGLDFDLGGSATRKLQLQLNQPLTLSMGTTARVNDSGGDLLGLDATLNVPLSDNFSLAAGVDRQAGAAKFQSLGSIQCMNGTLRADSYTASGCRFIDEPLAYSNQTRIDLGAEKNFGRSSASFSWFTQESEVRQSGVRPLGRPGSQAVMGSSLLSPNLGNPLLSPNGYDPLQYLNSEASGVNLNFKVGIATDTSGDIRVGLAFSRILDASYQGLYSNGGDPVSWTIAEPFSTAKMNVEWSRGAFSGGIQGFYRESVDFLNRDSVDNLTTFDVHFTWRTPWNANLSVGASNLLNAGSEPSSTDSQPVDPFESIYGRIPYVRYKQDL